MQAKLFVAGLGMMGMIAIFSILFIPVIGWLGDFSDLLIFPTELLSGQSCPANYIGSTGDACKLYIWLVPGLVSFFGISILAILVVLIWPVE